MFAGDRQAERAMRQRQLQRRVIDQFTSPARVPGPAPSTPGAMFRPPQVARDRHQDSPHPRHTIKPVAWRSSFETSAPAAEFAVG
jgi:hypothetical protein